MTVEELQARMTSREFAEWLAYYRIYPFGNEREDQRAGAIASAIVNVHRKKGSKPLGWQKFFPPYSERKPVKDWRDLMAKAAAIVQAFGGEDRRQ